MDCLNEALEVAGLLFRDRKTGYIQFTGVRPIVIYDTTAVELGLICDLTGTISAAEYQEIKRYVGRIETIELGETALVLSATDGETFCAARTPDEELHSVKKYYNRIGVPIEEEELPLAALWGTLYRRFLGENFAFDLLSDIHRLAGYYRIPLTDKVPVTFYWADVDVLSICPLMEVCTARFRFIAKGI